MKKSKEALFEVMRKSGVLEDPVYMSYLPFYKGVNPGNELEIVKEIEGDDDGAVDMLLNELHATI